MNIYSKKTIKIAREWMKHILVESVDSAHKLVDLMMTGRHQE